MNRTKEEIMKEFIREFCNDHNGPVRFLRGVFYDERDGAEQIISFLSSALNEYGAGQREEGKIIGCNTLYEDGRSKAFEEIEEVISGKKEANVFKYLHEDGRAYLDREGLLRALKNQNKTNT